MICVPSSSKTYCVSNYDLFLKNTERAFYGWKIRQGNDCQSGVLEWGGGHACKDSFEKFIWSLII
jgi:hypothetical protein